MEKRPILIVDDDAEQRKIFAAYLRFVGRETVQAADGADGVQAAREQRPAMITLDLTMPVKDGWETIRELKEDPDTRDIPVVAVTSHKLEWDRLASAGFTAYLEKPIAPYKVLEVIERCVAASEGEEAPERVERRLLDLPALPSMA